MRFRHFTALTLIQLIDVLNSSDLGLGRVVYMGPNDDRTAMLAVVDMAFVPVITHEDYVYMSSQKEEDTRHFTDTLSA